MQLRNGLAVLALGICLAQEARGFKPVGHDSLEQTAYDKLAETVDGRAALRDLVRWGVLETDEKGLPSVKSGAPDVSLERQFDTKNQAFHFMASSSDVEEASAAPNPKQALLERALSPNLALMRLLYDEVLVNPLGAHDAGRGVYVLMHIVVDSFSREHTERDASNRLVTIKGWRLLRPWWPEQATRSSGTSLDGHALPALLHHAFVGGADLDWRTSSNEGLTPEGERAVDALVSLLLAIRAAKAAAENPDLAVRERQNRKDVIWAEFIEEHFNNAYCPIHKGKWVCGGPSPLKDIRLDSRMALIDADAFPSWQFSTGAGVRFGTTPGKQWIVGLNGERHFVPWSATGFLQRLRVGGGLGATVPISDRVAGQDWHSGGEATASLAVSAVAPWLQWLGLYVGGGVRSVDGVEGGLTAAATWTLYFPRYVAVGLRSEHSWWSFNDYSSNLLLAVTLFAVHAREVVGFRYD